MTDETLSLSVPIATEELQTLERLNKISKECLRRVWAIRDKMGTELPPRDLSQMKMELSGHYSTITSCLNKTKQMNIKKWLEIRPTYASDTRTTKMVDSTESGILEMKLEAELKGIEKMLGALKQHIEIVQGESRNTY